MIDLQVNGAAGHDLTSDPERIWDVGSALSSLPTPERRMFASTLYMYTSCLCFEVPASAGADTVATRASGATSAPTAAATRNRVLIVMTTISLH